MEQREEYLSVCLSAAMGYVTTGMVDCFSALLISLMALRLTSSRLKPLSALLCWDFTNWFYLSSRLLIF